MTREEKEQWDIFMRIWVIPALKNTWGEKKCKEIVEALNEWEEQEPWIPVNEKLPKNDEGVLICSPRGVMAVAYYHIDDTHYPTQYADLNETGWCDEEGEAIYFEPIAWMPLPKPYKAESER